MRSFFALCFSFILLACGNITSTQNALGGNDAVEQGPSRVLKKIGDLNPSFYWVYLQDRNDQPLNRRLLDVDGRVLATVGEKFYRGIRLEGTGRLLDGTVLNFAARIKNPDGTTEIRFRVCDGSAPYGYGLDERPLIPFRSVAVDPEVVPMDSKLYIPAAVGAVLPDGSVHDGYFYAVDIGDAIKNKRIDVFTAMGDQSDVFRKVGFTHGKHVEVFLVE